MQNSQHSLFVAGLDYSITSDELKELFAKHGKVTSAKVITDKMTSQSRGFGFVDMESQADAEACIKELNGQNYKNRGLAVKIKEEKAPTRNDSRGDNGYGRSQRNSW